MEMVLYRYLVDWWISFLCCHQGVDNEYWLYHKNWFFYFIYLFSFYSFISSTL